MKRFITCCALLGLVVLTACSGDSPSKPPLPTPAHDTWAIPSLTVDNQSPYINVGVIVTATVTKNGAPAPDGTVVEFIATATGLTGFYFPAFSSTTAHVPTSGGTAQILFFAQSPGAYGIQARVVDAWRQVGVTYRNYAPSDTLQIYLPLIPNVGSRDGGETVTLRGKGIAPPAEVYFSVTNGAGATVEYQAVTVSVQASNPLSADGSITIKTPPITNIQDATDRCSDFPANVRVATGVGTQRPQSAQYTNAFTFLKDYTCVNPGNPPPPEIYVVVPDHGSARGGEQVTILGRDFGLHLNSQTMQYEVVTTNSVEVKFGNLNGIQPVVSPDGHQITVTTPRYQAQPLDADTVVDVTVTDILLQPNTTFTKPSAWVWKADEPAPRILSVAPTGGPLNGGTVVTIFGHGFQFPAQVKFGTLEATVNQVNDDTTPADNDTIICVTPNYTSQGGTPPIVVDVTVTNTRTGKSNTFPGGFTYGEVLFISGNTPTQGGPGTVVTIYGTGFAEPLVVDYLGKSPAIRMETVAVSGTLLVARFPSALQPACADVTGGFRVTLTDVPGTQGTVSGGSFTLLGNTPTVTSVTPSIVQETLNGAGVTPNEVTINGIHFSSSVLVTITGSHVQTPFTLPTGNVTVVSAQQLDVTGLPAPNDLNLIWQHSSCLTNDGFPGTRRIPTSVDVQVTNIPGNCSNTLAGALVYNPETSDCVAAPALQVLIGGGVVGNGGTYGGFAETEAGSCSAAQTLLIRNNGTGDLNVSSANLGGPFYFNAGTGQTLPAFTVPQFSTANYQLYFCPTSNDQLLQSGALAMVSNDAGVQNSLYQANLQGQEGRPHIVVNPLAVTISFAGGATGTFTISNTAAAGFDNLTWSATITGTDAGQFNLSTNSGSIPAGSSTPVTVTLLNAPATSYSANVLITHNDPTQTSPITVTLTGNP